METCALESGDVPLPTWSQGVTSSDSSSSFTGRSTEGPSEEAYDGAVSPNDEGQERLLVPSLRRVRLERRAPNLTN